MKKKILFATNHFRFSNGVAVALRSIIQNLDTSKYEIYLLTFYEFDKKFAEPVMDRINIVPGFGFYFRGLDKIVDLIPATVLYKHFIRDEYDLEISFQFGVPTRCLSVSKNPHRICWMHTYDEKMRQGKYYKKYPKIVTVAKIGRDKLITAGFDPKKCDYCYNIIDEDVILKKADEPIDIQRKHKYVVVTVARMMPDKAYIRYVECIKTAIEKKEIDAEFWLIGGGSEQSKVEQYVRDNNLTENIIILGKQENPYKYMSKADIYFCASYREGFSTACQEATLLGLPVISVNVDGAEELVADAGCGIVINNDSCSITNVLKTILPDVKTIGTWKSVAEKNSKMFFKRNRIKKILDIISDSIIK